MKMEDKQPDLIVGVDFGMTCTGVSYTNLSSGSNNIKWIQKWPGREHTNEDKVPTVVVYPINTTPHTAPSSWGFLSETVLEQNKDHKDWFKLLLDPVHLAEQQAYDSTAPSSMNEVERWYEDYLRLLYRHIEFKLNPELSRGISWHNAEVEFIFSVPPTWKPPTVEKFRSITKQAGFGSVWSHTLSIGLTEVEAAAVHTSVEAAGIFQEGEVLLVCDAGGGTTDLSLLRVVNTNGELEQLNVVFGANIGSAAIDYDFQQLVTKRLEQAGFSESHEISWEMMISHEFQNIKCAHGGPNNTPTFSIRIPHISPKYVNHAIKITNGLMEFTRWDLQFIFDKQIQQLIKLIGGQLISMQDKFPDEHVAHLILSGGLGYSPCVQERLRSHYTLNASHPNATSMQVRIAPDPQLAVCKGLVAERVSRIRSGVSILKWRRCRASYGIIHKEVYNPNNPHHICRPIVKDATSGLRFVTQSVNWFIRKGEPVSVDTPPIIRNLTRIFAQGNSPRVFSTTVVFSHTDSTLLLPYMSKDAQILCNFESDLSSVDESKFTRKSKRFWMLRKHYFQVDYQIKVLIGPADIRFEFLLNDNNLNKHQPITVDWQVAANSMIMKSRKPKLQMKPLDSDGDMSTKEGADISTEEEDGFDPIKDASSEELALDQLEKDIAIEEPSSDAGLPAIGFDRGAIMPLQEFDLTNPLSRIVNVNQVTSTKDLKKALQKLIDAFAEFLYVACITFSLQLLATSSKIPDCWNQFWEPPLASGKIRIRWTCQCGKMLWDDFEELWPGASETLQRDLDSYKRASVSKPHCSINQAADVNSPQIPPSVFASASNWGFSSGGSVAGATASAASPISPTTVDEENFLLLCSSKPNDTLRLSQLYVGNINDDVGLFRRLNEVYTNNRGRLTRVFSLRKINSINFRKFERHPRERVVICFCTDIKEILPRRTNPSACHPKHSPPRCNTVYDIEPTPPDLNPYVGRNGLEHLLKHPHEAADEGNNLPIQNVWLKRFPKKKTKLKPCPKHQYGLGWGIEFEEGWDMVRVMAVAVVFILAAIIFLISWWKVYGDLQGATGMGSLLLGFPALLFTAYSVLRC